MRTHELLLFVALLFKASNIYAQSGTFDFESNTTAGGTQITQTVSSVTLTLYSDNSANSMATQDWSAYSGVFSKNVATMNGTAKISVTLSFSQAVNIKSLVVAEFHGVNQQLKFTPNTGSSYSTTINGTNGSVVTVNFINITSIVVTDFNGGSNTVNLGFDNVIMDATLPVELISFNAQLNGNAVNLIWSTATEVNNYGFSLERKSEHSPWQSIGFIQGHGNSNSLKEYSFVDLPNGGTNFSYRLKQIDFDGSYSYSDIVEVQLQVLADELKQNYPNPFNPTTVIEYKLEQRGFVVLKVYDILGNEVVTLVNRMQDAGNYTIQFDANKYTMSSGVYFYKLSVNNLIKTKKMIFTK